MQDHHNTAKQAIKEQFKDYLRPASYRVDFRLEDITRLSGLDYDLFILDRDCTLQGYHSKKRVPEFEKTLLEIGRKSELVSNSSYEELLRIRDIYGDIMPVSKLVKRTNEGKEQDILLRFVDGELRVLTYDNSRDETFIDATNELAQGDNLLFNISYNYKKPNPKIIHAVVDINKELGRIPFMCPQVLMVGDRYLTDIVAGNLAGIDTAKVRPYKPFTDKPDLIALRYFIDSPLGNIMSRM